MRVKLFVQLQRCMIQSCIVQSLSVDLVFSLLTFFSLHLLSVSCIFSCFQSLETNFILNRIEVTNFISVLGI